MKNKISWKKIIEDSGLVKKCEELVKCKRLELADLIESNGNAADVINFISRFNGSFGRKYGSLTKFEFKQVGLKCVFLVSNEFIRSWSLTNLCHI